MTEKKGGGESGLLFLTQRMSDVAMNSGATTPHTPFPTFIFFFFAPSTEKSSNKRAAVRANEQKHTLSLPVCNSFLLDTTVSAVLITFIYRLRGQNNNKKKAE